MTFRQDTPQLPHPSQPAQEPYPKDVPTPDAAPEEKVELTIGTVSDRSVRYQKILGLKRAFAVALIALSLVVALFVLPLPYVIETPGPTFNVLGKVNDKEVITIDSSKPAVASGSLRAVTVGIYGGPERSVNAAMIINAWAKGDARIRPEEEVFPKNISRQELDTFNTQQMQSSQFNAEVAALEAMGYQVPATVKIQAVADKSPAHTKLQANDVLKSLQVGTSPAVAMDSPSAPLRFMSKVNPGTMVNVTVERAGQVVTIPVRSVSAENAPGSALGVLISFDSQLPRKIELQLGDTGGPSAGTIFALGIMDKLGDGSLVGAQNLAGTGAIRPDGVVMPIGGVVQKMYGAKRDGAKWFLVPQANCAEAVGSIPKGLQVIPISTLNQAHQVVKDIGQGRTRALVQCPTK